MSLLTIIIPFLKNDSIERFEETLASFLEHRTEEMNILVLNASVYEDHYGIKAEKGITFLAVDESTTYLDALNLGIQNAETEIVHTVLCGTTVRDDWYLSVLKCFETPSILAVIPEIIEVNVNGQANGKVHIGFLYERNGRVTEIGTQQPMKSWSRLAPHFAGAFYRKSVFLALGGFQSDFYPMFASIDMTMLLAGMGGRTVVETNSRLYLSANVLEPWQLDSVAWCREQERLYSRWNDWGGRWKTMILHRIRILLELSVGLFQGHVLEMMTAYRDGSSREAVSKRKSLMVKASQQRTIEEKNYI